MKTGVKEKDAYHVASAIYSNCDYFISTDIRLLKYKTDKIRMVTPIEFITETEGEE
jgi:predicted nucleic acid-binding protein